MSRQFSSAYDALRFGDYQSILWTVEVDFAGGTRRFSTTPVTFDGEPYSAWIMGLGQIGSSFSERRAAMSVSEMQLSLTNLEDEETDERFSGFVTDDFESIVFRVYMHFETEPGASVRELMFIGVPQGRTDWSVTPFDVRLTALSELYLSRVALRTLSDLDHPAIRQTDIGQTVAFVFGAVPRFPTRVVSQGSAASIEADPENEGTGELREAVVGANAVDEVWTLTFTDSEEVKFDSGSSTAEVGKTVGQSLGTTSDSGGLSGPTVLGSDSALADTTGFFSGPITVFSGGSNRQLLIVLNVRAVGGGGVPAVSGITVGGVTPTLVTEVTGTITSDSFDPNVGCRIAIYRIANPTAGSPTVQVTIDRDCLLQTTLVTYSNVDSTFSFQDAAANIGNPTSFPETKSGPAFMSLGAFIRADTSGTLSRGSGQTSRSFDSYGFNPKQAQLGVDTKTPSASSSGTSVPGDPDTANMSWTSTAAGDILGGFLTIRGITSDIAITGAGSSRTFNVPAPGMTVTQVGFKLYRDFPLGTTVTYEIDGSQFDQRENAVTHGPNGSFVYGFGSRFLSEGNHTLTVKVSGSAQVFRRSSPWHVSGVQRDAFAQSWQTTGSRVLVGIRLKIAKNPACSLSEGTMRVLIGANASGEPDPVILGSGTVQISSTTEQFVTFALPSLIIPASTTFWVSGLADQDGSGNGSILWGRNTSGGYADGNAQNGVYSGTFDDPGPIAWQDDISGQDFKFELVFADDLFDFVGSVSGAQGSGTIGATSTSSDGRLTIPATAWLGQPTAGDKFYVTVVVQDGQVIVCESPVDTPIQALGNVYWNGEPIEETGGTILDIDDVDGDAAIGTDGAVVGQTFRFDENHLLTEILLPLKQAGSPPGTNIIIQLVEANAVGTSPGEASVVLGQFQFPISGIGTSYADESISLADRPILARSGVPYAVILSNPDGGSAGNEVYIAQSTSDPYADGNAFFRDNTAAGGWQRNAQNDLNLRIRAATVTKELSIDDGTGENVARVDFTAQIPNEATITVDVDGGITDDEYGTYTGTPGALVRVPSHVIRWCLQSRMLVPLDLIDLDVLAETAAKHGSLYRFDGAILMQQTWRSIFLRMGFEARSQPYWGPDGFQFRYIDSTPGEVSFVVGPEHIVRERDGTPMLAIGRTDPDEILNALDIRYRRRFAEERGETAYDGVVKVRDEDSITDLGERSGQQNDRELFWMDFTRSQGMGEDQGSFYKSRFSRAKQTVSVTGKYPFLAGQEGDYIRFDLERPPVASQVLLDRPLAYYRMADDSTTMVDETGNGNDGTHPGSATLGEVPLVMDTEDGHSVGYDGTGGSTADLPALGTAWGLELWFQAASEHDGVLISRDGTELRRIDASTLRLTWTDSGDVERTLDAVGSFPVGEIVHVVATHDGQTARIFVDVDDGALALLAEDSAHDTESIPADSWEVGGDISGGGGDFDGLVDEVGFYGRTVTYVRAVAHRDAALSEY